MNDKRYLADCQGILLTGTEGHFAELGDRRGGSVFCLVNGNSDMVTVADLMQECGYTLRSLVGKRVRITVEEL